MPVLQVEQLSKSYGGIAAVDGISFEVETGEIFGMVGPNGAGKTTTVECVEGLRQPDGGRVRLLDLDPRLNGSKLRQRIGIQLQEAGLPDRIKVWEALDLFASFYDRTTDWRELLEAVGLEEKRSSPFGKLSGGQKQRLFIALSLVNDPDVVFLDELTTGLDPHARRSIWELVRGVRDRGKTIVLTTHFMDEAERLCDRLAIVNRGKMVALDTPANLIRSLGADRRVVITLAEGSELPKLNTIPGVRRVETRAGEIVVFGEGEGLVVDLVRLLVESGAPLRDLHTEQANLEDVFLAMTGHSIDVNGSVNGEEAA